MVYLVSYATKEFIYSQKILEKSALRNGVDKVIRYNKNDLIKTTFYKKNKTILEKKRGAGYWLWKPYFILKTLRQLKKDDILIYSDSAIEVKKSVLPLIDIAKTKEIVLFVEGGLHPNSQYTKRDCFVYMGCDTEEFWKSNQLMASIQVYKKTQKSVQFLEGLLKNSEDPNVITDIFNKSNKKNFSNFVDHRHDQSILSLFALKNKIEIFRDPTQWGNGLIGNPEFKNSAYDTLFNHHRLKKSFLGYFLWLIKNAK
jgi:hypothetical protein